MFSKFTHFWFNSKTEGMSRIELNCIVIRELFITTELPNDELSDIHTPDLPHLLL